MSSTGRGRRGRASIRSASKPDLSQRCRIGLLALVTGSAGACGSPALENVTKAHIPHTTPVDARLESESLLWRVSPPALGGARQLVSRFFDAVAREAGAELESLFAEDALFHPPNQSATPAALAWARRLSAGDYTLQVIADDVPVQLIDYTSTRRLAAYRSVHLQPQPGEVLAVVALPPSRAQGPALWGTELQLVLTLRDGEWRIRELWEDYVPR